MPWQQSDLDALNLAIQRGQQRVRFQDREVEYNSLTEMLKLRAIMTEEIATVAGTPRTRTTYASFSKE